MRALYCKGISYNLILGETDLPGLRSQSVEEVSCRTFTETIHNCNGAGGMRACKASHDHVKSTPTFVDLSYGFFA